MDKTGHRVPEQPVRECWARQVYIWFFLHIRSHIIRPLHPGLLLLLGHGNPSWNLVGSAPLPSFNTNDTESSSLMHNNAVLGGGGRQCAIEITSISLTGAHSALLLFQWGLKNKGESVFVAMNAVQALKTKIGLAVANESMWPLAFIFYKR